ncbi:MAG: CvpA family protein [bacterium]|nr:CvpA family protein [bacterium]
MSVEMLFLIIILFYGVIGIMRGCIRTLGGLVSMLVSGVLAKVFALPVAKWVFSVTNLEAIIKNMLVSAQRGISETGAVFNSGMNAVIPSGGFNVDLPADKLTEMISALLDRTALNVATMLSMMLLFALFMLICGHFVYLFEGLFKKLPLGKMVNNVLGFVCGVIKGIFVVVILYFCITCLNNFTPVNIPVNIGKMGEIVQDSVRIGDVVQNTVPAVDGLQIRDWVQ